MRITGASIPAARPLVSDPSARKSGGAAGRAAASSTAKTAATDPEAAAALTQAEKTADNSRTARRDALSQELGRLVAVARKLNGAGDLRSGADALQDLARQIAKVARALADAERALAPADRRGVPTTTLPAAPRAQPAAASDQPASDEVASDGAATEHSDAETAAPIPDANGAPTDAANDSRETGPGTITDDEPAPGEPVPVDEVAKQSAERAQQRREDARSGREGTRQLLLQAAGVLDDILKTVRKAERFEALLDPEAAKERGKAGKEIEGFALELRNLAGGFTDPTRGLGLDVTA